MNPQEIELLHLTTALRTQLMNALSDADLAFALPNNPTLGELCVQMGDVERSYIESFRTHKQDWSVHNDEPGLSGSVERLKAWYAALDPELDAVLLAIPQEQFQTLVIDRSNGEFMPAGAQFHTYREAILIFAGKCDVYLRAMGKPLGGQWGGWIG